MNQYEKSQNVSVSIVRKANGVTELESQLIEDYLGYLNYLKETSTDLEIVYVDNDDVNVLFVDMT